MFFLKHRKKTEHMEQKQTETEKLRSVAESGDAVAQFRLGMRYYKGMEIEQDYEQAANWFQTSAEQKNSQAQFYLGRC